MNETTDATYVTIPDDDATSQQLRLTATRRSVVCKVSSLSPESILHRSVCTKLDLVICRSDVSSVGTPRVHGVCQTSNGF